MCNLSDGKFFSVCYWETDSETGKIDQIEHFYIFVSSLLFSCVLTTICRLILSFVCCWKFMNLCVSTNKSSILSWVGSADSFFKDFSICSSQYFPSHCCYLQYSGGEYRVQVHLIVPIRTSENPLKTATWWRILCLGSLAVSWVPTRVAELLREGSNYVSGQSEPRQLQFPRRTLNLHPLPSTAGTRGRWWPTCPCPSRSSPTGFRGIRTDPTCPSARSRISCGAPDMAGWAAVHRNNISVCTWQVVTVCGGH